MPFRPTDTPDDDASGAGVPPAPPYPGSGFTPPGPPGSPGSEPRPNRSLGFGYFALVIGFVVGAIALAYFLVFRSLSDVNARTKAIQDQVKTETGARFDSLPAVAPIATIDVGLDAREVAVGEGGVWVARYSDGSVLKVVPGTNAVAATIKVGRYATGVAAGPGVWADAGLSIVRVDPNSGAVAPVPKNFGLKSSVSADAVVTGSGTVWATDVNAAYRLDPASGAAIAVAKSELLGSRPQLAATADSARVVDAGPYDVVVTRIGGDGVVSELARVPGARLTGSDLPPYVNGAVWFVVTDKVSNRARLVSVNDAGQVVASDFGARTSCPGDVVGGSGGLWVRCNARWLHVPVASPDKPDAAAALPADAGTARSAAVAPDGSLWIVAQNAANSSRLFRFPPPGGPKR